jgi:hypothetical protein
MSKEYQIVEVFACPNCGAHNRIEWDPGETQRTIPCIGEYREKRTPQTMQDDQGKDIVVELVVNEGVSFTCIRGAGLEFQERVLDHDLGREASWAVTKGKIADPGADKVLNSIRGEVGRG